MGYSLSDTRSVDNFKNKFIDICDQHLRDGRAKAFCFVFEDPKTKILKQSGVTRRDDAIIQLHNICGEQLTFFYVDAGSFSAKDYSKNVAQFNRDLIDVIGGFEGDIDFPCLLFFKIKRSDDDFKSYICDIECNVLVRPIGFIFSDMRDAIQRYIERLNSNVTIGDEVDGDGSYFFKVIKAGLKAVPLEVFKAFVGQLTPHLF